MVNPAWPGFGPSRIAWRARWIVAALSAMVSLSSSPSHGGVWTSHGPNGGIVESFAVDPTSPFTIYAGTDGGGVFKSVDGGGSWSALPAGIPTVSGTIITGLVVDPATPSNVYASLTLGIDGGILRSTDGGAHWIFTDVGALFGIAIDPLTPTTLYATGSPSTFKSTDAGATWTALESAHAFSIAIDPVTPTTVYVGAIGGVRKTIDGGAHWTTAGGSFPGGISILAIAIDPTAPSTVYAGTEGGVFKSVDAGDHWAPLGPPAGAFALRTAALAIDAASPNVVYAAGLASAGVGVYKSADGGAHWTDAPLGASVRGLALSSTTLVAGTGEGLFRSTDGAATWTPSNAGLVGTSIISLAVDPEHPGKVYAGSQRSDVARTDVARSADGGDTWSTTTTFDLFGNGIAALAVDPTAPGTVYAGDSALRGVFKTVDDGATWIQVASPETLLNAHALLLDPTDSSIVYAGVLLGGVLRSPDRGATWIPMNTGLFPLVVSMAIDPSAPTTLYAGTDPGIGPFKGVFKTTDAGAHWEPINAGLPTVDGVSVLSLTIDPTNPTTLYAVLTGAGVFKSTDGGASWTAVNNGLDSQFIVAVAADAVVTGTVYVATFDQGVFTTFDGGGTWVPTNDGLYNTNVRTLAVEPGRVYAGTSGSGTFAMAVASTTTSTMALPTTTTTLPPEVLGRAVTIKDPKPGEGGDPSKRKIVVTAKEPASNDALDAVTLARNGALVTITTFGATPTTQTFSLPAPWTLLGTTGAKYGDKHGVNGPVKSAVVKRSSSGVFELRVTISGKVSGDVSQPQVLVVPPNPGSGARLVLQIDGGPSYCVGFGGAADGQVVNKGALVFKVSRPTAAVCP